VTGAGPGILGLSYAPVDVTSLPAFLGAQFDARMAFDNGVVWSPFVRAAWVHEFEPARGITASFLSVPGASFAVDGPRSASDAVKLDLGARLMLNRRAALTATFTGEFSDRTRSYAGRAGLRMEF
jgi:outer membrane autotransporter protein